MGSAPAFAQPVGILSYGPLGVVERFMARRARSDDGSERLAALCSGVEITAAGASISKETTTSAERAMQQTNHSDCQLLPRLIRLIVEFLTPKVSAISILFQPLRIRSRTLATSSNVSFALLLADPAWLPPRHRPFLTISAELSRIVPTKRWCGLQQARLSHEWQTHTSCGQIPLWR